MQFLCNICGFSAGSKGSLKSHLRKHDDREYECENCGKKIIGYNNYNSHKMSHKKKPCPICWKPINANSIGSHKFRKDINLDTTERLEPLAMEK